MASPIVAGVAAIVKATHPEFGPLEIKNRIEMTADMIDDINPDYAGLLGTGRVNVFQAAMYDYIPNLTVEESSVAEHEGDGDGVPNPGETCSLVFNIMNNWFDYGLWAQADETVITITTDMPGVTFVDNSNIINAGTIFQAGSYWNTTDPVLFQTDAEATIQEIPFNVNITANPTSEYPYNVDYEIVVDLQLQQGGWPVQLGGATTSASAISDIDGDGLKEVIFGDINGGLHVVNPDGTEDAGFPIDLSGNISTSVALADLDEDGHEDIVAINSTGTVYAIDYLGNEIFTPYATGSQVKGNAMITDIGNNGSLEIILVTFIPETKVIILNADGTEYSGFPVTLENGGVLSSPALADLNGDDYPEVIAVSLTGSVYAVSTADGTNIAGWPVEAGSNSWLGPNVCDIDNDNDPEVIVPLSSGAVKVYEADGSLLLDITLDAAIKASAVTGDLNADGNMEIILGTTSGNLYVLNNDGSDFTGFPVALGAAIECTAALVDMDDNGTVDILVGDNNGILHSIDITGTETVNFPYSLGSSLKVSPAVDDIDNDGDIDIAIADLFAYNVIDYKQDTPVDNIVWATFKRNNQRTGNGMDPTNDVEDGEVVPEVVTYLGANYPNPFNPTTKIQYSIKTTDHVTLDIYNVKGQLVKTLVNGTQDKGIYIEQWDGFDNNNRKAGTGIYFYKLQTSDYISTRKMIMLK